MLTTKNEAVQKAISKVVSYQKEIEEHFSETLKTKTSNTKVMLIIKAIFISQSFRIKHGRNAQVQQIPWTNEADIFIWACDFLSLLINPSVTALICARDLMTKRLFKPLKSLGYNIPQDLSLISYDNQHIGSYFQWNTIDAGFGELCQRTFNAITGYFPVKTDATGTLFTQAYVVDHGTVKELES